MTRALILGPALLFRVLTFSSAAVAQSWSGSFIYQGAPRAIAASVARRGDLAFDQGYSDGYEKGMEDARKHRSFDPSRHRWFRSADHGYESHYGARALYKNTYRDGFRGGYESGFRDRENSAWNGAPRRLPY
jgi:hypothetical protein